MVNGREYRYERLETKRVGKKVVTKDQYLGAVKPVQGKIDTMSTGDRAGLKKYWVKGSSSGVLVEFVRGATGRKYADNTVEKWCRKEFGKRGKKR